MKKYKLSLIMIFSLVVLFTFSGCQSADLVAKVAVTSFDELVKAIPDKVAFDSQKEGWVISGIDGKERIILSKDFSRSPDIAVEFDAAPFMNAGLDVAKLPDSQYSYDKSTGKITMSYEYGKDKFGDGTEKSALNTLKEIVKAHRSIIGYHEEGDHYKISLGNSNSFGWAKNMGTNKADMVFVLNPKPLMDAGVDPGKIKEWIFTKMPVTDKDGKPVKVDIFMKAFNVR